MVDTVELSAGSGGAVVNTDDVGGVHTQIVKTAYGPLDTVTLVTATVGMPTVLLAGSAAVGKLAANSGVDIGDVDILSIAAGDNNIGNVDVVTLPNVTLAAGTNTNEVVGDVAHDAAIAGNPLTIGGVASAAAPTAVSTDQDAVRAWFLLNGAQAMVITAAGALIAGDAANGLDVDVTRLPALVAGDNNIGNVDIVTMPAEANSAAIAASLSVMDDWDNTASDGASVSGDVAHDGVDAGEPVKIGAKAFSPDGTTPGTAVAESDRTNLKSDLDGLLYVQHMSPRNFSYHDDDAAAVTTDGTAAADPGDGFAVFITDIIFSIGAATASSIFLEEGSTKILGPYYLEAIAGRGVAIHFATPKRCTASTAILVTNTGSILFSIDILGFVAAV